MGHFVCCPVCGAGEKYVELHGSIERDTNVGPEMVIVEELSCGCPLSDDEEQDLYERALEQEREPIEPDW